MNGNIRFTVARKPLVQTEVPAGTTRLLDDGTLFLDFGKAAFGTLLVPNHGTNDGPLVVHLGEKTDDTGRIDRDPPGTVRYKRIEQATGRTGGMTRIIIPPDARNTGPGAVKMPEEIGEVFPFRYAEIEAADGLDASTVRQVRVHYPFDDDASSFTSSDKVLDAVWDICKYTIKVTSFCGVYVDGDRERIPYEGDAYINQLGHYGTDAEYAMARYTLEYLLQHPTWPTEWQLHTPLMAWTDYLYSGCADTLRAFYEDLRVKTLHELSREDGLISTQTDRCDQSLKERLHLFGQGYVFKTGPEDLVDWPPGSFAKGGTGERDDHEMLPVNTVVNAFHAHALRLMSRIAAALDKADDRDLFAAKADQVAGALNRLLFDPVRGVYVDGEGSAHASLHSNMFMLAFGLVPAERRRSVTAFVKTRGMACSVYGAQHLLEALYDNNEDGYALELMNATHDRGWWNMIRAGATMTLEAWDIKYKNNLDWNHAWGAAPANIIPRFVLGVRPLAPGFTQALIEPHPGGLSHASGKVPTPLGPVAVSYRNAPNEPFELNVTVPSGMTARVGIPVPGSGTRRIAAYRYVDDVPAGIHEFRSE